MQHELKITGDGSPTIYVPDIDEHYHSVYGAYNESMHVFIQNGFNHLIHSDKTELTILEIGLGTGLNLLLTYRENLNAEIKIQYHALEPFPLEQETIDKMHFNIPGFEDSEKIFKKIHLAPFDETITFSPQFEFKKIKSRLEDFNPEIKYNLIYFDAFGPRVQPEIWSPENFRKLFEATNAGGALVTYCSKGDVRRTMQAAGFKVEKLAGSPHKREMLRAIKLA
jgi:tRNA U34 5-methylaminomethyl-2-thiouridine-forming methyltransferase MnmC